MGGFPTAQRPLRPDVQPEGAPPPRGPEPSSKPLTGPAVIVVVVIIVRVPRLSACDAGHQLAQAGEPLPQQRPDHRQVADVDGHAGLADVPEHVGGVVDVGEVEDLGHERGEDDKDAEGEDDGKDNLLAPGQAHADDERDRDPQHQHVGADVEAALDDGVVLERRALRVRWRQGPVPREGLTGREEGDLAREPAGRHVAGEPDDEALVAL